mgnify:FL=1
MKNEIMVVKSNTLIEASYRLSTQEQKVILSLTAKIKNQDEDFKNYTFSVKEFAEITGANINSKYSEIKNLTSRLLRRVFTINEPSGPLQLSWLSAAKYFDGEGIITLRFDPGLKPYLLQLKDCFTKINLLLALRLKSSFSIRIYELLKQYESIGSRLFILSELKTMLGITDGQYKLYGHFKSKVLNVAQKELAEKTDITFDYEEIKVGRGVGKIRFIFKSQSVPVSKDEPEKPTKVSAPDDFLLKLFKLVPQPFQNQNSIRKLVEIAYRRDGFDYVMRNIVYSNDHSNALKIGINSGKKSNYRVYLAKALNNDYGLAYMEDLQVKKEAEQAKQKTFAEAEMQKQREKKKIDQERENREKARAFIASCTPENLETYAQEAGKRLSPDSFARYNRKDVIGLFEFKRRLEDVVMEHTGLRKPQPQQVAASELSETTSAA